MRIKNLLHHGSSTKEAPTFQQAQTLQRSSQIASFAQHPFFIFLHSGLFQPCPRSWRWKPRSGSNGFGTCAEANDLLQSSSLHEHLLAKFCEETSNADSPSAVPLLLKGSTGLCLRTKTLKLDSSLSELGSWASSPQTAASGCNEELQGMRAGKLQGSKPIVKAFGKCRGRGQTAAPGQLLLEYPESLWAPRFLAYSQLTGFL